MYWDSSDLARASWDLLPRILNSGVCHCAVVICDLSFNPRAMNANLVLFCKSVTVIASYSVFMFQYAVLNGR